MNEHIERALADLKDRQTAGEWMPCPRCGRDTMKPNLHTNALSRHAQGIYICDECGTAEAMLDFMNNPLPTEMWAMFRTPRPESDLKALPGTEEAHRHRARPHPDRPVQALDAGNARRELHPLPLGSLQEVPRPDGDLGAALPGEVRCGGWRADPAAAAHRRGRGDRRRPAGAWEVTKGVCS